ncbi:MAG TPA: HAD family hydrolase [Thermaerobacter sp.]
MPVKPAGPAGSRRPARYRLLALDVDGTLLTSRGTITRRTKRAIRQALAAGIHVTLATGRVFPSARLLARALGLRTPLVVSDGAFIIDPGHGPGGRPAVLHAHPMDGGLAREVTAFLTGAGLPVVVHFADHLASSYRPTWQQVVRSLGRGGLWHYLAMRRFVRYLPPADLPRYVEVAPGAPAKISAIGDERRLRPVQQALLARFGGRLHVTHSASRSFDVLPAGVSKASGLQRLAALLGVHPEEIVAIGDNDNDREMLCFVGLGVAMGNAAEDVRRCARFVTRTNDEDGVAHVIERFLLAGEPAPPPPS